MNRRFRQLVASIALLTTLLWSAGSWAAGGNAIRDAEIETDIRNLAAPIFRAAGLQPQDVGVYMIDDKDLNSFVAGGQAIFINTGLILKAEQPNQLIGVIAHETGHIAGGHVLRA